VGTGALGRHIRIAETVVPVYEKRRLPTHSAVTHVLWSGRKGLEAWLTKSITCCAPDRLDDTVVMRLWSVSAVNTTGRL
jgi:hypothetical protein